MSQTIAPLIFSTAPLPAEARFEAWRSALSNFDLSRRETTPFAADARIWLLSPLVMVYASVDPLRYERDDQRVRRDDHDHFALVHLVSGGFTGDFGRGEVDATPGSLTVLDMRRACWTDAGRLDAFILSMPRAFLAPSLGDLDPHGMVATGGMATLLGASLATIRDTLGAMDAEQGPIVARLIRDMVAETLLDSYRAARAGAQKRDDALVTRVRTYVDAHLGDTLDVAAICSALGTSRSTIYRAFGGNGGVLQQIQRRRLHALRTCLDDSSEQRSIAELAAALGFTDKSHATRWFKREYGVTPGDYRRLGAQALLGTAPMEHVPSIFDRWTMLLD